MEKNNFSFIYNYLKSIDIQIDKQEFEMQVFSHPDFPSILAFSDTLKFFGIENDVFNVSKSQTCELQNNFIAVLNNDSKKSTPFFAFVQKVNEKFTFYDFVTNNNRLLDEEKFIDLFQETVLIVKAVHNHSKQKSKITLHNTVSNFFIALFLLLSINFFNIIFFKIYNGNIWYIFSVLILSLIGWIHWSMLTPLNRMNFMFRHV